MQILPPIVSVIMATYNAGSTVASAIDSIRAQTFGAYELIICDDASTDNTWQLLSDLSTHDPRIILLRNKHNTGAAAARNRCIEQAKGQYIAIMDADDLCGENRLEVQKTFLDKHPEIAFVGLQGQFFYRTVGDRRKIYPFIASPQSKDFLMTLPFVHASLMFRREVFQFAAYPEGKRALRSEDYALLMALYANGFCGKNLTDALYYIRENEDTFRRRTYRRRITECFVKWRGFRGLGLMPAGIPFAIKPLLVGLMPPAFLESVKALHYRSKMER